jgi:hypothetical protein
LIVAGGDGVVDLEIGAAIFLGMTASIFRSTKVGTDGGGIIAKQSDRCALG